MTFKKTSPCSAGVHIADQSSVQDHGGLGTVRSGGIRRSSRCSIPVAGVGKESDGQGHPEPTHLCVQAAAVTY